MYASAKETVIPARGKALVETGIAVAVPEGTYGRVAPRSGLASKHFIDVGAGVIDADYRGEVKVLLFNFSEVDFTSMSLFLVPFCFVCLIRGRFYGWVLGMIRADNVGVVNQGDRIAQLVLERVSFLSFPADW